MKITMQFSTKIKNLRLKLNFSQQEFADRIGVSRSVLSQIEIQKIKPSVELIATIAREFNISPDYFFVDYPGQQLHNFSMASIQQSDCDSCRQLFIVNETQKEIIENLQHTICAQQKLLKMLELKVESMLEQSPLHK